MSALLANASATFTYQGASVTLSCSSPTELKNALATFGIGAAANDAGGGGAPTSGKSKPAPTPAPAATAPATSAASQTAASSAPAAAAQAAQGDQGNASAAADANAASTASSNEPSGSPAVTFEELKKAFLALSTKAGGREKCEAVLKPFNLPKLSAATPEQYGAVLAEIQKAGA